MRRGVAEFLPGEVEFGKVLCPGALGADSVMLPG